MPLNQATTNYFIQLKGIQLADYCSVFRAPTHTIKNKQLGAPRWLSGLNV